MVTLSEKARRDGLLALEDDVAELGDPFAQKGIQLVVDGADSELVRAILSSEIDGMAARHSANAKTFATAGGFAPTLGILGTVMSLVHVLENLDSPSSLGHSIAGAFIATLYGVGSANLIFLPIANKLKEMSGEEIAYREMLLEAILSIQAGDNPRLLREKLETFLAPLERGAAVKAAAADGERTRDRDGRPRGGCGMSATGHRSRRGGGEEHDGGMERWLLTYADMITLLLALFIVLWSISSVNISKFVQLKASLHEALSGKVIEGSSALLSGGSAVLAPQGSQTPTISPAASVDVRASILNQIASSLKRQDTQNLQARAAAGARVRHEARALGPSADLDRRARPRDPRPHRRPPVRPRPGDAAAAGGCRCSSTWRACSSRRRPHEPDPGRGQHGQRADLDAAVPFELGAVDGARRPPCSSSCSPTACRPPALGRRLRRPAADRNQHHRRRPQPQPARRPRRPSSNRPGA